MKSLLIVIPARSGSKGVIGKNMRELLGEPLISWSLKAAVASRFASYVLVSTDSEDIKNFALSKNVQVPFTRPLELAQDDSSSIDVVLHALNYLKVNEFEEFEYVALIEPTSPLRTAQDIDQAFANLLALPSAEAIVSVAKVESQHPDFLSTLNAEGFLLPYQPAGITHKRRQDLDDFYFPEGSIYISKVSTLVAKRSFYHEKTVGYILPRWKSAEIDDPEDLIVVEALLEKVIKDEL